MFEMLRTVSLLISAGVVKISLALTSIPRNVFRDKKRPATVPPGKEVAPSAFSALLADSERVSDELRTQLQGFDNEDFEATIRMARRLLDSTLMPMAWIMYFCNYLDRVRCSQICERRPLTTYN
jgi:hypothetical protein